MKTLDLSRSLIALCVLLPSGLLRADDTGVELARLQYICTPAQPNWCEELCAKVLQQQLQQRYGAELAALKGAPLPEGAAIFVGRQPALASGLVGEAELEQVKHDGYLIRATGDRIALAGYRGLGTLYAGYALLARMGVKLYPDRSSWTGPLEVFEPLPGGLLPPLHLAEKPYFEYRGIRPYVNQGRFGGGSWQDRGDVRTAANPELFSRQAKPPLLRADEWPSSLHTAGYLVPRELYYDEHPEYYATRADGTRIPRETDYHRLTLNVVNPEVRRICAQRTLEWMNLQPDRRFFCVQDGDARACQAPESLAADPLPHYTTDRALEWVNYVAAAVRQEHPEKRVLTCAYIDTAKPPVFVKPEPNVYLLYCPWYWDSANNRSHGFTHPQNFVAMEEFVGWLLCCPDQVGVFDYFYPPMVWLRGQVDRLKFYAKNGVRVADFDGAPIPFEDLCHYVVSWLCWDPLLDSVELQEDFIRAFYGPAAQPISEYFALHHASSARYLGRYHRDADLLGGARRLFQSAEQLAGTDDAYLLRVQHDVLRWLNSYLSSQHSELASSSSYDLAPVTKQELDRYQQDMIWYLQLAQRLFETCKRRGDRSDRYCADACQRAAKDTLATCGGVKLEQDLVGPLWEADEVAAAGLRGWVDPLVPQIAQHLAQYESAGDYAPAPERSVPLVQPSGEGGAGGWSVVCSTGEATPPPEMGALTGPTGQEWRGLTANLALSSLPVVTLDNSPRGVHTMHAGTFLMQKQFDPPVDVKGCHLFDIQLYVSAAVPVTVYLDTGMKGLRSDLQLHAGAQIARVDIRDHRARWPEFRDWDQKIRGIKIDFWPQDNFYPYPQTQDVQVVLVGITARNHDQTPESLPHRGEAVWLTHFRPNLPHGVYRLVDSGPRVPIVGMQHLRQVGGALDYERYSPERFRSSTPNGLLSPIFAILTGPRPSQAEQQAAGALQEYLQRSYGVRLPINPSGRAPGPDTGNVVVIGRQAALAAGLVTEAEFRRVGAEGFVLRSRLGRIAIAGADDPGTLYGVSSFLQEQGVRFCGPGEPEQVADYQEDGFLHETYLLDWPWFKDRPVPGGWRLRTQGGDQTPPAQQATTDPDSVRRLAAAIKDCARHQEPVPQTVLADAGRSRLSTYVAARLLWDPFLDTSRLIEAFEAAGSRGAQARLPGMRAADRG